MVSANEARPRRSGPGPFHVVQDAYERYGPALLRKAERILQSPDDAGDIVHALFVDLMQGRDPNVDIKYLYRAVGNRCINFLRDRGNRERLLEHQQHALRGPARTHCEDAVIGLDLLARLAGILDSRSLEILICRFWDDMSQDEIAAFLGTSRKTVGKRLIKIRAHVLALRGDPPASRSKDA
jgi:RNA polymerase sigma factor (sigma-70 family)